MEKATPVNRVGDDEVRGNCCNLLHMADRSRSRCGIALITGHRYLNPTEDVNTANISLCPFQHKRQILT